MQDDLKLASIPHGAPCEGISEDTTPREPWDPVPVNNIAGEFISRRGFLQGATLAAGILATAGPAEAAQAPSKPVKLIPLSLTINGEQKQLEVDPRISLLDLLREQIGLTGTKKGCDHGQCGACTVLAEGRRINACLALALAYGGQSITTIEGIAHGEELHPVQQAFLDHDGYQCGYCTPGQIVSAVALLNEVKGGQPSQVTPNLHQPGPIELTPEEIKERMSGNLCRCGAYPGIVAAVQQAYRQGVAQS